MIGFDWVLFTFTIKFVVVTCFMPQMCEHENESYAVNYVTLGVFGKHQLTTFSVTDKDCTSEHSSVLLHFTRLSSEKDAQKSLVL